MTNQRTRFGYRRKEEEILERYWQILMEIVVARNEHTNVRSDVRTAHSKRWDIPQKLRQHCFYSPCLRLLPRRTRGARCVAPDAAACGCAPASRACPCSCNLPTGPPRACLTQLPVCCAQDKMD